MTTNTDVRTEALVLFAVAPSEARCATPGVNIGAFCATPGVALGWVVSRKHAIASGKRVFYEQLALPVVDAHAMAGHAIACDCFSEDGREGVDAFLQKRTPHWKGPSSPSA